MTKNSFIEGIEVYYRGMYGRVDFVCEKYISVCVRRLEHRSKDVCILVYPSQFDEVALIKESTK